MGEPPTTYTHIWEDQFGPVDAALWEWLAATFKGLASVRRVPRSSASTRYRVATGDDLETFSITLRQLDPERVLLTIELSPGMAAELQLQAGGQVGWHPRDIIARFFQWRMTDVDRPNSEELPYVADDSSFSLPTIARPARGGRSSYAEDIQARERLAAGEDREAVFQDWQRQVKRSRKRSQPANLRDTFRKVVVKHVKPED